MGSSFIRMPKIAIITMRSATCADEPRGEPLLAGFTQFRCRCSNGKGATRPRCTDHRQFDVMLLGHRCHNTGGFWPCSGIHRGPGSLDRPSNCRSNCRRRSSIVATPPGDLRRTTLGLKKDRDGCA